MTHCLELLDLITKIKDIKLVAANYTANGIEATVEDQFNKQKYQINIIPEKEGKIYES